MHRLLVLGAVALGALVLSTVASAWSWPADGEVLRPFALGGDAYAAGQHRGIDVAGQEGTPIRAPAAGTVSFAGSVPTHGRGVTILTADGHAVTLFHLGAVAVAKGQVVEEGAVVGTMGWSGEPEHAVPSVHLGIRVAAQAEGYVDPLGLLPARRAPPSASPPPAVPVPAPVPAPVPGTPPGDRGTAAPAPAPAPAPAVGLPAEAAAAPPPVAAPAVAAAAGPASSPAEVVDLELVVRPALSVATTAPEPRRVPVPAQPGLGGRPAPGGAPSARTASASTLSRAGMPTARPRDPGDARPSTSVSPPSHDATGGARERLAAPLHAREPTGAGTFAFRQAPRRPSSSSEAASGTAPELAAGGAQLARRLGALTPALQLDPPPWSRWSSLLVALLAGCATAGGWRLARRIDRNGAVLPHDADLLRQLDAAHRPRLHDRRGGRVRAASAAARP